MIASIDRMYHVDQFVFEISVKMSTSGAKLNNFLWGNEIRGTIYFWNLDAGVSYDWYTRLQEDILTNQKKKKQFSMPDVVDEAKKYLNLNHLSWVCSHMVIGRSI